MKELPDKSVDLVLTDPPYEQTFNGGGSLSKKYEYRKKDLLPLSSFEPIQFLNEIKRVLKKTHLYAFTSKNLLDKYIGWAKENKYNWDILVWVKNNPLPSYNNSYLSDLEFVVFIRDKNVTFNNGLEYNLYRKAMLDNVHKDKFGHPTTKHLWMIEKFLAISSNENDIVLDPFLGSGTTAVACIKTNRNFIGIEKEKKYVDIAQKRVDEELSQLKLTI
jgi:DNA modification methylase